MPGVSCGVSCFQKRHHLVQPIRTQMRVTPRHGQALVPQKIGNVFKRGALHSQPAGKRVAQVMPMKVLEVRFHNRVIKPVPRIFERFTSLT